MRPEYDEEVPVKRVLRFRHDCPSAPEGAVEILEQEEESSEIALQRMGGRRRTFRMSEIAELYA